MAITTGATTARGESPPLHLDAQEICRALLRIDTTNPPGNERPAAELLAGKLREAGYEPVMLEAAPSRDPVPKQGGGSTS